MIADLSDPDRALALGYVPGPLRVAVAALWALDETLGQVVAAAREPLPAQLRLAWWREALAELAVDRLTGQPVLDALARVALPAGVAATELAALVDGWEPLLDALPLSTEALELYASARGDRVFTLTAQMLDAAAAPGTGGGWALADFARRCSDPPTRGRAWSLARARLTSAPPLPRPLRLLARLAAADARTGAAVPRAALRVLWAAR